MSGLDGLAWGILAATAGTLGLLIPFALHRLALLNALRRRSEEGSADPTESTLRDPAISSSEESLPVVTVQLPIYNEAEVIDRLLDAVGSLQHPADRLEVQILDDSTDETRERAARRAVELRRAGLDVHHIHRHDRTGFKAGALEAGRARARGEFFLILDADFVPRPGLIRELLPSFADPEVGMVQARWDHLNEETSWLTRCQAVLLDGHFFLEQGGRQAAGRFINFNGTAGMWRARTIEDAGGWSAATLTEDLDISYRAQMAGWRFVFRPGVAVPAELPQSVPALELQQQRWAQGGVQTARKLLGQLWRGGWPLGIRIEGTIHLLGHLAHPLTVVLGVLILPSALARRHLGLDQLLVLDVIIFTLATLSFLLFYVRAGRARGRPWREAVRRSLVTLALGIGLTAPVSRAVLRGLRRGLDDPFRRTPKTGFVPGEGSAGSVSRAPVPAPQRGGSGDVEQRIKVALTLWMVGSIGVAVSAELWGTIPLLLLFAAGWAWLALGGAADPGQGRRWWMPRPTDRPGEPREETSAEPPPRGRWTEPVGAP